MSFDSFQTFGSIVQIFENQFFIVCFKPMSNRGILVFDFL